VTGLLSTLASAWASALAVSARTWLKSVSAVASEITSFNLTSVMLAIIA